MDVISKALGLRLLTRADFAFADAIREHAGWNQTLADWDRFLAMAPEGCFLAEWNGVPAGTATTIIYSQELAWIGMVIVHPDFRRLGIGRALLEYCIHYLREQGIRCIKLDATPAGKLVYDSLGFTTEWTLKRWAGVATDSSEDGQPPGLRPWEEADSTRVDSIDTKAFGVSRSHLLAALVRNSGDALVLESACGQIEGFGFARPGSKAMYLGPIAANSSDAGLKISTGLMRRHAGKRFFWDIPDANTPAVAWAQAQGFTEQRPLIRMFLGQNTQPGDPSRQFALAGPEVG